MLDWTGDALLCCNDWLRHSNIHPGNINTHSLEDIWYNSEFDTVRQDLLNGKRLNTACSHCSINGTLIGSESVLHLVKHKDYIKS